MPHWQWYGCCLTTWCSKVSFNLATRRAQFFACRAVKNFRFSGCGHNRGLCLLRGLFWAAILRLPVDDFREFNGFTG